VEDFAARGRRLSEEQDPKLAADIRAIVEPHTYSDPGLKSARRYTDLSAAEVRAALVARGHAEEDLPCERTMRDILNRMNYRLKRIRKGQPLEQKRGHAFFLCNNIRIRGFNCIKRIYMSPFPSGELLV
jgi:hypothetical protein